MTAKNQAELTTKNKHLDIYLLHLAGLSVGEIVSIMGCSQRTVYYGIEYGNTHVRNLIGESRLLELITAKQQESDKHRKQLEQLWSGNKTILERKIVGYQNLFGGFPLYQKKVTIKPDFTFRGAIKRFGKLHAVESAENVLRKVLRKKQKTKHESANNLAIRARFS